MHAAMRKKDVGGRIKPGHGAEEPPVVYVFRDGRFSAGGGSVVSAARPDIVVAVYGGGGLKGEAGLEAVFGGAAYFRNDETGVEYLGVWGSRKASRLRSALRRGEPALQVVAAHPPARLIFWSKGRP